MLDHDKGDAEKCSSGLLDSGKNPRDNLMNERRIRKYRFSGFEWKDVLFPLICIFILHGATVELEAAELLPLLHQRNT